MELSALGPYAGAVAGLVIGAIGAPLPEEIVLLGAGASAHQGYASLGPLLVVVAIAVLATDALVFAIGRRFGPAALSRPPARWLLPERRRAKIERLIDGHGAKMIFAARFLPGLRAPTFLLLGAHHLRWRWFFTSDAIAVGVCVPLLVGIGYHASSGIERISADIAQSEHVIAIVIAVAVAVWACVAVLRSRR